jgi:hypothetical protein
MVAFTFRMPAGIPGDINRVVAAIVEPQVITPTGTTGAPTAYGTPVVIDNTGGNVGNVRALTTTDTTVYGLLARPFPTTASQSALGTSVPPTTGACDVMVRGYMSVLLSGTTAAAKGGAVYVWVQASNTSGNHVQGGWEAATSTGSILIANSYWMGPADTNNITEVAFQM